MKHILTLIMLVLIAASCTERSDINVVLDHADSIMVAHPDSALSLLDSIGAEKETFPRSQLMRYELLHADAQNKAYVDFTTDSVMVKVAEYYDNHGTPNEKMRAYYLLGCTYRDLHEAPMTLQCYQTAVEKADTTSNDCDFYTLAAIYGQMAELFFCQYLPEEELKVIDDLRRTAILGKDHLTEIVSDELRVQAYSAMQNDDSILVITNRVIQSYYEIGDSERAAQFLCPAIDVLTRRGQNEEARRYIAQFDSDSHFIDENGNLLPGKELYLYYRGIAYLRENEINKAKTDFYRILNTPEKEAAYKGLLSFYTKLHIPDSMAKYATLYAEYNDSSFLNKNAETIERMTAMHNYSRNQKLAAEKDREANRNMAIAFGIALLLLCSIFVAYHIYNKKKEQLTLELSQLNYKFLSAVSDYEKAQRNLSALNDEHSAYKQEVEEEVSLLRDEIAEYKNAYAELQGTEKEKALMQSPVVGTIRHRLSPRSKKSVTSDSWQELLLLVDQCLPEFYNKITANNTLSQDELRLAILTRLKFAPGEIAIIMDKSKERISNIRQSVNKKLFDEEGSKTFTRNIVKM